MSTLTTAAATLGLLLATTAAAEPSADETRPVRIARVAPTAADRQAHLSYKAQLKQVPSGSAGALARASGPASAPDPAGCLLYKLGAESTSARDCLGCHDGSVAKAHLRTTHPVDIDYSMAQYRNRGGLRPEAEVVRRGGFLPDGKVRCTTCHDSHSQWAAKINLPPGAVARPPVDPFQASSFSPAALSAQVELAPGSEVSPKPLCLLCHSFD